MIKKTKSNVMLDYEYLLLIASYDDYVHYCKNNVPNDESALEWTMAHGKSMQETDNRPVTFSSWCFLASYPDKLEQFYDGKTINHLQLAFHFIYNPDEQKRNIHGFNDNIARISLFIPKDMLYFRVQSQRIKEVYTKVTERSLLARWEIVKNYFQQTVGSDQEFFISLHDGLPYVVNNPLNIQILTFAKNKFLPYTMIPDVYYLSRNGYKDSEEDRVPWENKLNIMYWRGSSTGGHISWSNWKSIPRLQLALMSLSHDTVLDAKITDLVQIQEGETGLTEYIRHKGLVVDKVPFTEFHRYKYLINVDGNSCAWDSMFLKLKSKSVVFHVESDNIQWYYEHLVPWKHYIPIKPDLSDLLLKFEWALLNDTTVKKMAQDSSALMESL